MTAGVLPVRMCGPVKYTYVDISYLGTISAVTLSWWKGSVDPQRHVPLPSLTGEQLHEG